MGEEDREKGEYIRNIYLFEVCWGFNFCFSFLCMDGYVNGSFKEFSIYGIRN